MTKRILTICIILLTGFQIKAQKNKTVPTPTVVPTLTMSPEERQLNCYNKWSIKFEERGAEEVPDGIYTDVIVTSRMGARVNCYSGKAEVRGKRLLKCWIVKEDNSEEEITRTWRSNTNTDVEIINGISESMITVHNELINVLWPKKLKAKKAPPKLAPDPNDY